MRWGGGGGGGGEQRLKSQPTDFHFKICISETKGRMEVNGYIF